MSSFLRKAMWPAALIVGMFVLIGAIGTATAPTASAATDEVCAIVGPFPDFAGLGTDNDNPLLIEGNEYLFVVVLDDPDLVTTFDFNVDDETGRAGITAFAITPATPAWDTEPSVDNIVGADLATLADWIAGDPDFVDDIESDFFVDLQVDVLDPLEGNGPAGNEDDECTGVAASPEDVSIGFVTVDCTRDGTFELTAVEGEAAIIIGPWSEQFECVNSPSSISLTASPTTVESYPAIGNVSHSLITATITDGSGHYVAEGYTVDWSTDKCRIEGLTGIPSLFGAFAASNSPANAGAIELAYDGHTGLTAKDDSLSFNTNPAGPAPFGSYATAVLHCEGADPGTATVTAQIDDDQEMEGIAMGPSADISASTTVTVIGPPAFITMVAEPTELVCGEKAQILITVTDALNQNVSNHTRVELITNYGGVIGGTGSSLGFPGVNPVNPLSSSAAETFSGVATAFLLTSTNHVGSYEVVAAAGGSNLGGYSILVGQDEEEDDIFYTGSTGVFSTAVITNQVTVTCTEGTPDVTAPDTGTGTISPPNTGDAGLASRSAGTASLFVIAGAAAFVLAGFAKFGFARR